MQNEPNNQIETAAGPKGNGQQVRRMAALMVCDAVLVALSFGLALLTRFDFSWSQVDAPYLSGFRLLIVPSIVVVIAVFWLFKLYHSIWSFASTNELLRLAGAWALSVVLLALGGALAGIQMPISYWVVGLLFGFVLTCGLRFGYRFLRLMRLRLHGPGQPGSAQERVMIIGGGQTGRMLVHEMTYSDKLNWKPCCIIDDNPNKRGRFLEGVPIVGDRADIVPAVGRFGITQIVFAIPSASGSTRQAILETCQATGCKILVMPGVYQLLDGQVSASRLRSVNIEDLLGRDPIAIDNEKARGFVGGKTVLVTGGGGSIGSELCRQVALARPAKLVILDIYENNAYDIQQELVRKHPGLDLAVLVGSVRDKERVRWVFDHYRPDVVFHAAAHKHVPLMEKSPNEAVKNNVMGTYNVAAAALEYGTGCFVLISTDKAVNPTNIMGASKRVCEMIVQMMQRTAEGQGVPTRFSAVRFGNVLGSNGSVIPLFERQIAEGGPVTVTDRNIIRYFMTIPEAVSLVLQAGSYAEGGEIFVLDMGDPVKIDDMARKLIRLSGYEPDVDIEIVYTGLRPGEKLFEEMLMAEEGLKETPNRLIHVGQPIQMDDEALYTQIKRLAQASEHQDLHIKQLMAQVVPTYCPDVAEKTALPAGGPSSANNATADHPAAVSPQVTATE